jgi:hypothetical protein
VKMICAIEFYILLFKSKIANGAVIIIGSHNRGGLIFMKSWN